jgi:hypothetical protein
VDADEAYPALLAMLRRGLPLAKWLSDEKDLSDLKVAIGREASKMENAKAYYGIGDLDYYVDSWCCGRYGGSSFYKTISLSDGRAYRIEGQFHRDRGGAASAEVNDVLRLLTRREFAQYRRFLTGSRKTVKVVPTVEEARDALLQWLGSRTLRRDLAAILEAKQISDQVADALESRGVFDGLRRATPERGEYPQLPPALDGWFIFDDDASFERIVPLSPLSYRGPMLLFGRFESGDDGNWKVVLRDVRPLVEYSAGCLGHQGPGDNVRNY